MKKIDDLQLTIDDWGKRRIDDLQLTIDDWKKRRIDDLQLTIDDWGKRRIYDLQLTIGDWGKKKLFNSKLSIVNRQFSIVKRQFSRGFTLLEILVSMVILSIALTLAWQTFSGATRAWTGSRKLMDKMHHGDFVLTQLSAALRSMAFFEKSAEHYGFRIENNSVGHGEHSISWVTASDAFIPRGESFEHGLHRIEVGGGTDEDGEDGLVVTVWSHIIDDEDAEKKSWFITDDIKGLSCQVFDTDKDEERWRDDWEYSNAIPGLIEITLYAEPMKKHADPVEFRQLIEIPLGPPVTNDISEAR